MKLIVFALTTMLTASAFAAPMSWSELVQHAAITGAAMDTQFGTYHTLTRLEPNDAAVAHTADYFSTVGWTNSNGEYSPARVEIVSENWRIDAAGNWDIDQWGFVIALDGTVQRVMHNRLVEDRFGSVLSYDAVATTADEFSAKWASLGESWRNGVTPATKLH